MKLYFYRGDQPNFGDELNNWLLPKVFPDFFDGDDSILFLGIGSILFDHHPADCKKIVFGSGYGAYTPVPEFDDTWSVYCVRGPRTADACGLSRDKVAGDTAILMHKYRPRREAEGTRIAFMPHWESIERGNWQQACERAGVYFIDPRKPVEEVLLEIEGSKMVITEAMHGAIVADALRVPWVPLLPFHKSHRFKWYDWAEALDMKLMPYALWPSSAQEFLLALEQRQGSISQAAHRVLRRAVRYATKLLGTRLVDAPFISFAALRLSRLARKASSLSSDSALNAALSKLELAAAQIKKDFR